VSESRAWNERLRWDYSSSTELLLQYLDSRILPGFVALDRGRITGFTFCVYEGNKAVVGDVWSETQDPGLTLHSTQVLLHRLLELLLHSPNINRVESQLLLYASGSLNGIFVPFGFIAYPRLYMQYDLPESTLSNNSHTFDSQPQADPLAPELKIARWTSAAYDPAAVLIHNAYAGHIDALVNDQYCSLHGSLRFLHNIVRFPGCGTFEPAHSWTISLPSGELVAILLCSRIASDVAHITQICVSPAWSNRGLGGALLSHAMSQLSRAGYATITLTVTESNQPAVRLYERFGFYIRHRFDAMVLEKPYRSY
jgi:ribosomal protein S18 acetylase RimI-like enzyme